MRVDLPISPARCAPTFVTRVSIFAVRFGGTQLPATDSQYRGKLVRRRPTVSSTQLLLASQASAPTRPRARSVKTCQWLPIDVKG